DEIDDAERRPVADTDALAEPLRAVDVEIVPAHVSLLVLARRPRYWISAARRMLPIIEDFSMYSRACALSAAVRRMASSALRRTSGSPSLMICCLRWVCCCTASTATVRRWRS